LGVDYFSRVTFGLMSSAYLAYNSHDIIPFRRGTLPNGGTSTRPGTCILESEFGTGVLGNIFGSKLCYLAGSSLADGRGRTRVKEDEETVEPVSEMDFLSLTLKKKSSTATYLELMRDL
jgi:hypothetical protein